jgi:hypothetical protein
VEVVVTLRESINFFCGGCPDSVMKMSSMSDCGHSLCAKRGRLKALDCAVAHAVTAAAAAAAGEEAPAADADADAALVVSREDVRRESILSYASTRARAGNGDVMVVKLTVNLRAPATTATASSITDSLSALESLDTPAACAALVDRDRDRAHATDRSAISDGVPVQWRLPAAVVIAQPACGTGVMGRACAYICPAEWTKEPSVQSDIFSVYTAASDVSETDGVSQAINKNRADVQASLGNAHDDESSGRDESERDPACAPGTTAEEALDRSSGGEPCVMAPSVTHESFQVFKFVGSAHEERHAVLKVGR